MTPDTPAPASTSPTPAASASSSPPGKSDELAVLPDGAWSEKDFKVKTEPVGAGDGFGCVRWTVFYKGQPTIHTGSAYGEDAALKAQKSGEFWVAAHIAERNAGLA